MTTPHPPQAARPEEAPGPAPPSDAHHALAAHEVVLLLGTDVATGLTSHEVQQRRRRFGANELKEVDAGGPLRRLLGQVDHPLVIVLLVSAVVAQAAITYLPAMNDLFGTAGRRDRPAVHIK
jgi:magnesium-transporting ATPase (P-type)